MPNHKLKIVHVCSYRDGGAGHAAYRLHEALSKKGYESSFVTIHSHTQSIKSQYFSVAHESFIHKQINRIEFRLKKHLGIQFNGETERQKKIKKRYYSKFEQLKTRLDCEIATIPFTDYNILKDPLIQDADIIHLHWIGELIDYPSFFKNNKKPTVWTLHDMNPFLGLFHYKNDELQNRRGIEKFDDEIQRIKKKAINSRRSNLFMVTPSHWLQMEAQNSDTFKNFKVHCIPNSLSSSFSNIQKTDFKSKDDGNNLVFLFISQGVKVRRKGFDLLMESLKKINIPSFTLLVLGEIDKDHSTNPEVRFLGTIIENEKLIEYFSIANAVIIPAREDNLPNVMLESFACGTPVIGFPVGGIKEHVINFQTGLLAEEISSESLAKTIQKFYVNREKFDSRFIRDYAIKHFNEGLIAQKYLDLYKQILKK